MVREFIGQHLKEHKNTPLRFAMPGASFVNSENALDVLKDKSFSSIYLLEPLDQIRHINHELKAANEFSKFLASRGQALLFIGDERFFLGAALKTA